MTTVETVRGQEKKSVGARQQDVGTTPAPETVVEDHSDQSGTPRHRYQIWGVASDDARLGRPFGLDF